KARDGGAVPQGGPDVTFRIDRHSVGEAVLFGKGGEHLLMANLAGLLVVVEAIELAQTFFGGHHAAEYPAGGIRDHIVESRFALIRNLLDHGGHSALPP